MIFSNGITYFGPKGVTISASGYCWQTVYIHATQLSRQATDVNQVDEFLISVSLQNSSDLSVSHKLGVKFSSL